MTATLLSQELGTTNTLMDAIRAFSSASSLHEIIDIVKRAARAATAADGATFVFREDDTCYYADEDAIAPLWKGQRFPMESCVSGWSMHHRLAVVIPDIDKDPRVPRDLYRKTFVRSMVMVPIRSAAPIGAIGAYWAKPRQIAAETVHWLQALADATSAALEAVMARAEADRLGTSVGKGAASEGEIVRMCAWTRRLHHDGQWLSVEAFLRARFGVMVTHGIATDALDALESELSHEFKPETPWISG